MQLVNRLFWHKESKLVLFKIKLFEVIVVLNQKNVKFIF